MISFENFASIEKEEADGEYLYTLTYEESYMEAQVNEDLEAADSEENIETMEEKI